MAQSNWQNRIKHIMKLGNDYKKTTLLGQLLSLRPHEWLMHHPMWGLGAIASFLVAFTIWAVTVPPTPAPSQDEAMRHTGERFPLPPERPLTTHGRLWNSTSFVRNVFKKEPPPPLFSSAPSSLGLGDSPSAPFVMPELVDENDIADAIRRSPQSLAPIGGGGGGGASSGASFQLATRDMSGRTAANLRTRSGEEISTGARTGRNFRSGRRTDNSSAGGGKSGVNAALAGESIRGQAAFGPTKTMGRTDEAAAGAGSQEKEKKDKKSDAPPAGAGESTEQEVKDATPPAPKSGGGGGGGGKVGAAGGQGCAENEYPHTDEKGVRTCYSEDKKNAFECTQQGLNWDETDKNCKTTDEICAPYRRGNDPVPEGLSAVCPKDKGASPACAGEENLFTEECSSPQNTPKCSEDNINGTCVCADGGVSNALGVDCEKNEKIADCGLGGSGGGKCYCQDFSVSSDGGKSCECAYGKSDNGCNSAFDLCSSYGANYALYTLNNDTEQCRAAPTCAENSGIQPCTGTYDPDGGTAPAGSDSDIVMGPLTAKIAGRNGCGDNEIFQDIDGGAYCMTCTDSAQVPISTDEGIGCVLPADKEKAEAAVACMERGGIPQENGTCQEPLTKEACGAQGKVFDEKKGVCAEPGSSGDDDQRAGVCRGLIDGFFNWLAGKYDDCEKYKEEKTAELITEANGYSDYDADVKYGAGDKVVLSNGIARFNCELKAGFKSGATPTLNDCTKIYSDQDIIDAKNEEAVKSAKYSAECRGLFDAGSVRCENEILRAGVKFSSDEEKNKVEYLIAMKEADRNGDCRHQPESAKCTLAKLKVESKYGKEEAKPKVDGQIAAIDGVKCGFFEDYRSCETRKMAARVDFLEGADKAALQQEVASRSVKCGVFENLKDCDTRKMEAKLEFMEGSAKKDMERDIAKRKIVCSGKAECAAKEMEVLLAYAGDVGKLSPGSYFNINEYDMKVRFDGGVIICESKVKGACDALENGNLAKSYAAGKDGAALEHDLKYQTEMDSVKDTARCKIGVVNFFVSVFGGESCETRKQQVDDKFKDAPEKKPETTKDTPVEIAKGDPKTPPPPDKAPSPTGSASAPLTSSSNSAYLQELAKIENTTRCKNGAINFFASFIMDSCDKMKDALAEKYRGQETQLAKNAAGKQQCGPNQYHEPDGYGGTLCVTIPDTSGSGGGDKGGAGMGASTRQTPAQPKEIDYTANALCEVEGVGKVACSFKEKKDYCGGAFPVPVDGASGTQCLPKSGFYERRPPGYEHSETFPYQQATNCICGYTLKPIAGGGAPVKVCNPRTCPAAQPAQPTQYASLINPPSGGGNDKSGGSDKVGGVDRGGPSDPPAYAPLPPPPPTPPQPPAPPQPKKGLLDTVVDYGKKAFDFVKSKLNFWPFG